MKLTKKQVMNIRKYLSKASKVRTVLGYIAVKEYEGVHYALITNGYSIVTIPTELEVEGYIPFDELDKWYKLASAKEFMYDETLADIMCDEPIGGYPNIIDLRNRIKTDIGSVDSIAFNSELLENIRLIMGAEYVELVFGVSNLKAFEVLGDNDNKITAILMPVRVPEKLKGEEK